MVEGYTKSALENRVAGYYEDLYNETFPAEGAKRPVSIKDLEPILIAFEHRLRGAGYSDAFSDLNRIDADLLSWGHYQRLVDMRTALENEGIGARLTQADRGHNLGRLGVAYLYMANRPNAETFLARAATIADECGDRESAGLWSIYRGLNLIISGDLQKAKECLRDAENKVEHNLNKAFLNGVEGYICIGVLGYHDVMQSKEMLERYDNAVDLYGKFELADIDIEVRSLRTFIFLHRARSYTVLGQHTAAESDFEEARKEFEALDNQRVIVYWHTIKGSADREKGLLSQAKIALEHALRVSIAIGDLRGEQITNNLLGKVYRDAAWAIHLHDGAFDDTAVEHLRTAEHYFERALSVERKLGNVPRLVIVLRRLGNIRRELARAAADGKEAEKLATLAQENYTEAAKAGKIGDRTADARAEIHNWSERSRLVLARPAVGEFPASRPALQAQQILIDDASPVVVPVVQQVIGLALLRNKDAYKAEDREIATANEAFTAAADLLERALSDLATAEEGREDREMDLKRRAELTYALGTAIAGQAVSATDKSRGELEKQALEVYESALTAYRSPGFVRDTCHDLIALRDATGSSEFGDSCLALFREYWRPANI